MTRGRISRRGVRWLPALGLLLAGCTTPSGSEIDPLTGGPPIPAAPPSTATAAAIGHTVPSTPAPTSTTSTAALAAGTPSRETDPRRTPDPKAPPVAPADWRGSASSTILHGPQNDGVTATPVAHATEAVRPTVAADRYEQAQAVLRAYGATDQCLKQVNGDQWSFSCEAL